MAVLFSVVKRFGGDIGAMMLAQCLAGFLGVRALVLQITHESHLSFIARDLLATGILLTLASPLTPMSIYLATFWKDVWLSILLVWIAVLLIRLASDNKCSGFGIVIETAVLVALISTAILVRHNAIAMLPSMLLVLAMALRRRGIEWRKTLVILLIPFVAYGGFARFQYTVLNTERMHPESQIYATDLIGMALISPQLLDNLPFTRQHLGEDYADRYEISDNSTTYIFGDDSVVDPEYVSLANIDRLGSEYASAIREAPLTWIKVKLLTFGEYIRPDKDRYGFHTTIERNEFGISFNERFGVIRSALFSLTNRVETSSALKFISFVHVPWIVLAGLASLVLALVPLGAQRRQHDRNIGLILIVGLSYYLSYLLAITAPDFRFMYPATLLSQVILLAGIGTLIVSFVAKLRGRRTAPSF